MSDYVDVYLFKINKEYNGKQHIAMVNNIKWGEIQFWVDWKLVKQCVLELQLDISIYGKQTHNSEFSWSVNLFETFGTILAESSLW